MPTKQSKQKIEPPKTPKNASKKVKTSKTSSKIKSKTKQLEPQSKVNAPIRQKLVYKKMVVNGGFKGGMKGAMLAAGYSKEYASNPQKLKKTQSWNQLVKEFISDELMAQSHNALLNATMVEHQVYPLGIEDQEIIDLLSSVNCVVRKIMHSETQKHVWFWARDNNALAKGLDMGYKIKNRYKETLAIEDSLSLDEILRRKAALKKELGIKDEPSTTT